MNAAIIIGDFVIAGFLAIYFHKKLRLPTSNYFAILTILCLVIAISLILWGGNILTESRNRLQWPTATAIIVESAVIGDRAFRPDIVYEYNVLGQTYQNSTNLKTPGFGNKRSRRDTAKRIISDFQKNKHITIYYNPNDPAESYVRPGPEWSDYMKYGIGHLLLISAVFGVTTTVFHKKNLIK